MKTTHILKILNGKGGDYPDSYFDSYWLEVGIGIEHEHTSRRDVAKIIAKAHLFEFPMYYEHLLRMEEDMKREMELYELLHQDETSNDGRRSILDGMWIPRLHERWERPE